MKKLALTISALAAALMLNAGWVGSHYGALYGTGDESSVSRDEKLTPVKAVVGSDIYAGTQTVGFGYSRGYATSRGPWLGYNRFSCYPSSCFYRR